MRAAMLVVLFGCATEPVVDEPTKMQYEVSAQFDTMASSWMQFSDALLDNPKYRFIGIVTGDSIAGTVRWEYINAGSITYWGKFVARRRR